MEHTERRTSLLSVEFAGAYLVTMRPYLLFVSGVTGIVGLAFAPDLRLMTGILVSGASFLSYGFGQALTDCFQVDTDSISAPYRPLTRGIVGKTEVMVVSIAGLALCVGSLAALCPLNLLLGAAAGCGLASYTYFKRRWWGGPWYNAWIVTLLCIMTFLAGSRGEMPSDTEKALWMLLAVFFGYANFVLAGYFKDISADAVTDYRTLPVVFGRSVAALVSDGLATAACICAMLAMRGSGMAGYLVLSAGIAVSAVAQIRLHRVTNDLEAHRAISPVVHAYLLLLSGIAVSHQPGWLLPLLLFYGAFILTMSVRPAKNQV